MEEARYGALGRVVPSRSGMGWLGDVGLLAPASAGVGRRCETGLIYTQGWEEWGTSVLPSQPLGFCRIPAAFPWAGAWGR